MKWEYKDDNFLFNYPQHEDQKIKDCFAHFFKEYQKIQDKMSLKFPYSSNFKVAKIFGQPQIFDTYISVDLYYDGLNGEQLAINLVDNNREPIQEGFKAALPLKLHYTDSLKLLDVPMIKSIYQCLIETFHWSANYGIFFDPFIENLLLLKSLDRELYLLIPNFSLITSFFFKDRPQFTKQKFDEFRKTIFQKETSKFFDFLIKQFIDLVKPQDEDQNFYKSIVDQQVKQQQECGVDYLFCHEQVRKRMWKYTFKQGMILYQLDTCKELRDLFKYHKQKDQEAANSNQKLSQSYNLIEFLSKLKTQNSKSHDILTFFAKQMLDYLKQLHKSDDAIRMAFRPNWKEICNRNCMEKVDQQQQKDNDQNTQVQEFNWVSQVDERNILYQFAIQRQQEQNKFLINKYRFELLENKNCYIVRTTIQDIIFSIDTADDIMFLVNAIQKESGTTNLYVDDNRRLTLYSSIVMGQKIEILAAIVKIIDLHQIHYMLIFDFYQKNIQNGRSVRDIKYQHFVREIQHYVNDYEKDFEDQMKNIESNDIKQGF